MAIRDLTTIINDAIAFIQGKRPNIATFVGTVTRDVVIESPAQEFNNVYTELARTQKLQSVDFPDDQTEEELDALASNYGLQRLGGKQATGTITFQIRNFSTSSSDVAIPLGTVVGTPGSDEIAQVSFVTTQAALFQAIQAPSYFNPSSGLYEITVQISAESVGTASNVSAGAITQLITSINGVDTVTNTVATTGGEDIESNTELADRIRIKLSGNNVGTPNGIISEAKANVNVIDAIVVTPNDVEMLRDQFGGAVDVYILGQVLTPISEVVLYTTTGSQEFILQHQPAKSVTSITGVVSSAPYTFIQGTDYNFVLDPTTLFNGSTLLTNKVVFNIGGTNPDNATNITINYVYDSLIESLQLGYDADDNHIITADILVKEATQATVDIVADVTLFPGNSAATSISAIQTALSTAINALGLGDSIDRSDVISIIESVSSVDQVNVNTLQLFKNLVLLPPTVQRLQIFKTEYPRLGIITINVL